jgi:hypothetical protein
VNRSIERYLLFVVAIVTTSLATSLSWAAADEYGYPLKDRFVATVVGTPHEFRAKLPEENPFNVLEQLKGKK